MQAQHHMCKTKTRKREKSGTTRLRHLGHRKHAMPMDSLTCTEKYIDVVQFRSSWSADYLLIGKQNDLLDYQNANIYPDVVNINEINELSLLTL